MKPSRQTALAQLLTNVEVLACPTRTGSEVRIPSGVGLYRSPPGRQLACYSRAAVARPAGEVKGKVGEDLPSWRARPPSPPADPEPSYNPGLTEAWTPSSRPPGPQAIAEPGQCQARPSPHPSTLSRRSVFDEDAPKFAAPAARGHPPATACNRGDRALVTHRAVARPVPQGRSGTGPPTRHPLPPGPSPGPRPVRLMCFSGHRARWIADGLCAVGDRCPRQRQVGRGITDPVALFGGRELGLRCHEGGDEQAASAPPRGR